MNQFGYLKNNSYISYMPEISEVKITSEEYFLRKIIFKYFAINEYWAELNAMEDVTETRRINRF